MIRLQYLVLTSFLQLNVCILDMDSSVIYISFNAIYIQDIIQYGLDIFLRINFYTYTNSRLNTHEFKLYLSCHPAHKP